MYFADDSHELAEQKSKFLDINLYITSNGYWRHFKAELAPSGIEKGTLSSGLHI